MSEQSKNNLNLYNLCHLTFAMQVMGTTEAGQKREITANKRLIAQKQKRISELDKLFERIYEDNVIGKLNDERFAKVSEKYEQEQQDLRKEVASLETAVATSNRKEFKEQFSKMLKFANNAIVIAKDKATGGETILPHSLRLFMQFNSKNRYSRRPCFCLLFLLYKAFCQP